MKNPLKDLISKEVSNASIPPSEGESAVVIEIQPHGKAIVTARVAFSDALTGLNFRPGDVLDKWDDERVAEYACRGLINVSHETGPSELKDA